MAHALQQDALVVSNGDGDARWWLGMLAEVKATGADTDGRLTLIELTLAPGTELPLHIHHREKEGLWVLEGTITVDNGGHVFEAGAGDYVLAPLEVPHKATVGDRGCRMLLMLTPAVSDALLWDTSEPAVSRTVPPPQQPPPNMDRINRIKTIFAAHGTEFLD